MKKLILGACFLLALCAMAEARPRDDAMMRAYRCNAQPATRVWLDCFYGAAQPVRASLGMSPAPAAQTQLSEASPSTGQPADVAQRNEVMVEAARCGGVAEDRSWLDCFYAASNPVRSALGLAPLAGGLPAMARTAAAAPPPAPLPQRTSGGILSSVFGATVIQAHGRMANYSFDGNNKFVVTLDNGQVWSQLPGDTAIARWKKPARSYEVTVTNGAFGSHNLTVKGMSGMYKVRLET